MPKPKAERLILVGDPDSADIVGAFQWVTESFGLNEDGSKTGSDPLVEAWDREDTAIRVGHARAAEGYRVNVFKYVAFSVRAEG